MAISAAKQLANREAPTPQNINEILKGLTIDPDAVGSSQLGPGAVHAIHANADLIHGQTSKSTLAAADEVSIYDAAGTALKKVAASVMAAFFLNGFVQVVESRMTTYMTSTTNLPNDDTVPNSLEGDEVMTATITPSATANKVLVLAMVQFNMNASGQAVAALFKDAGTAAIAVQGASAGTSLYGNIFLAYLDSPNTTSAVTYKIRIGAAATTIYINGNSTGRKYGGTMANAIYLLELKA